jgi:hypothetical protein
MEVVVNEWPGQPDPLGATWIGPQPLSPGYTPGPWGQQPPAGGPWQPPMGPPAYGQPFGPLPFMPPRSRKPLWITLSAVGAVIVVVAIILAVTLTGGDGGGSAADAVKGYLEALARGDAETALSYGVDQPASKDFLSSEVLKKQIAQWPISNIKILNEDSTAASIGIGRVHVVVNFGDKTSDTTLEVKKDHGKWKLPAAALKLAPAPSAADDAAAKTLTIFGRTVGESTIYVFPGWMDVGSTNQYLGVTTKPLLLDQLALGSAPWLRPTIDLSDAGRQAVNAQLEAAFAKCQRSNLLAPPGCPLHLNPEGFVEGTAAWGQADLSGVKLETFSSSRLTVRFFGDVKQPLTVKGTNGNLRVGNVTRLLGGTADLTQTPPELNFS